MLGLDPPGLTVVALAERPLPRPHRTVAGGPATDGGGLPWTTRPASIVAADRPDSAETEVALPDLLPSRLAARADEAFETFDDGDLRLIGGWLERAVTRWPQPALPASRGRVGTAGGSICARPCAPPAAPDSRSSELAHTRRRQRPRRIVFALRCKQIHATLRDDLSAPDARGGDATGHAAARGVRLLHVADPAHPGAVAPVGGGGAGPRQRQGRRPLRRHSSGSQPRRAAGRPARQRAARCGRGDRLGRLGRRRSRGDRTGDGPAAPARRTWWSGSIRGRRRATTGRWPGRWPPRCRTATCCCRPTH